MNTILISKTSRCSTKKASKGLMAMFTAGALLCFAGASSSCQTTRGFGQDVEKVGDKIQEKAR